MTNHNSTLDILAFHYFESDCLVTKHIGTLIS